MIDEEPREQRWTLPMTAFHEGSANAVYDNVHQRRLDRHNPTAVAMPLRHHRGQLEGGRVVCPPVCTIFVHVIRMVRREDGGRGFRRRDEDQRSAIVRRRCATAAADYSPRRRSTQSVRQQHARSVLHRTQQDGRDRPGDGRGALSFASAGRRAHHPEQVVAPRSVRQGDVGHGGRLIRRRHPVVRGGGVGPLASQDLHHHVTEQVGRGDFAQLAPSARPVRRRGSGRLATGREYPTEINIRGRSELELRPS